MGNSQSDSKLITACKNNVDYYAIDLIDNHIKSIDELNTVDNYRNTALMIACENNLTNVATKLIEKKVNLNCKNTSGETALSICIKKSNSYSVENQVKIADIALLLITNEADLNNYPYLALSIYYRCYQVADKLLQCSINLNALHDNISAVIAACATDQKQLIENLIRRGADLTIGRVYGCDGFITYRNGVDAIIKTGNLPILYKIMKEKYGDNYHDEFDKLLKNGKIKNLPQYNSTPGI